MCRARAGPAAPAASATLGGHRRSGRVPPDSGTAWRAPCTGRRIGPGSDTHGTMAHRDRTPRPPLPPRPRPAAVLGRVVEHEPERVPSAGAYDAHTVPRRPGRPATLA